MEEKRVRHYRPAPSDDMLSNPHKGCCTFQHFAGDPLFPGTSWTEVGPTVFSSTPPQQPVIAGYLPSTVAYCRWYWNVLEPEEGKYDFSMIDGALESCRQRGQTLAVRLMAFGSGAQVPLTLPNWYSAKYPMEVPHAGAGHGEALHPVHDSPEYLAKWGGLIREFASRYDQHPLLESIDIAYIGPWGEGAGTCSQPRCREFAELWKEAFVNTLRIGLIDGSQMVEAVKSGAGWRCDCFGDIFGFGGEDPRTEVWCHHYDAYPREVVMCGAQDAWKTAPVHFETCWVPMGWYNKQADIDFIIQQGLKFHGTYFMPKSSFLPPEWMDKLRAFCKQLGYRYIFRQAILPRKVALGGKLRGQFWIENVGVAPIYYRYDFVLRMRQGSLEFFLPLNHIDIRNWLPGDAWLDEQIQLPAGIKAGWVDLAAGLVGPSTNEARIDFANKDRFANRWMPLSGFEVVDG
jgi:hypothetical protein